MAPFRGPRTPCSRTTCAVTTMDRICARSRAPSCRSANARRGEPCRRLRRGRRSCGPGRGNGVRGGFGHRGSPNAGRGHESPRHPDPICRALGMMRILLITGASSGIGASLVRRFAVEYGLVLAAARRIDQSHRPRIGQHRDVPGQARTHRLPPYGGVAAGFRPGRGGRRALDAARAGRRRPKPRSPGVMERKSALRRPFAWQNMSS